MLKQFLIYVFICWCFTAFGQDDAKVLWFIDEPDGKYVYAIEIQETLSELHEALATKKQLFNKVTYLNEIQGFAKTNELLRSVINDVKKVRIEKNKKWETSKNNVFDLLLRNDYFLKVKIIDLGTDLEFQFMLYKILKDGQLNSFPYVDLINEKKATPCRFNKEKVTDDIKLAKIKNAIYQLFPQCNLRPNSVITLNDLIVNERDTVYIGMTDKVVFDAGNSTDKDTPFKILNFEWRQVNDKGITSDKVLHLSDIMQQEITFENKGFFTIGLIVNDGIARAKEAFVNIKVVDKPNLALDRKEIWLKSQADIIDYRRFWFQDIYFDHNHLSPLDSFTYFLNDSMYKNEGLFREDSEISTRFIVGKNRGIFKSKLNINPGEYQFNIQTQHQKYPLLKSNTETLTFYNKAHFPLWMSLHTEDVSFHAKQNDSTKYIQLYGFSLGIRAFMYRYFFVDLELAACFNTTINGIKSTPFPPTIISHYGLGYKVPVDGIFKSKVKVDPSVSLFYRNLPSAVDWANNNEVLFDWSLGWEVEISVLPLYNHSLSFDISAMQVFGSDRIILGVGFSFTFDVYDMF